MKSKHTGWSKKVMTSIVFGGYLLLNAQMSQAMSLPDDYVVLVDGQVVERVMGGKVVHRVSPAPSRSKTVLEKIASDKKASSTTNSEKTGAESDAETDTESSSKKERVINPAYGQRLMDATRRGDLKQIRWLLKSGADFNYEEPLSKATPLFLAMKSGWIELAQLFQEYGADLTAANDSGTTYLHVVSASGKLPMAKYLISIGADPKAETKKGWLPLHHAARFGHTDLVRYYLTLGADPNKYTSDGFTPLGLAVHARHHHAAYALKSVTTVAERLENEKESKEDSQLASNATRPRRRGGFFSFFGL